MAAIFSLGTPAKRDKTPFEKIQKDYFKFSLIDLTKVKLKKEVLAKFPLSVSEKYGMVVFKEELPKRIYVAALNPEDRGVQDILDFIKRRNNIEIALYQTDQKSFDKAMGVYKNQPVTEDKKAKPFDTVVTLATPPLVQPIKQTLPQEPPKVKLQEEPKEPTVQPTYLAGEEFLAEKNLDEFLGKPITKAEELKPIIQTNFVPKILASVLSLGIYSKASDIHLEPLEKDFRFRLRVDGVLRDVLHMPLTLQPPIISRIKILSNLKIDETRVPQDGRFDVRTKENEVDIRVSTLPTTHGEKVALRLLDKSSGILTLEKLGLEGSNFERLIEAIKKPFGVVLSTGPTGSGKSTTLYAILQKISSPAVNVITLEDPVEYEISGLNQTQVKPKIGFSFAEGLRSVLRQDPNIIMVGEIRDKETASLVTHAALTGHLVLTTLHTNDAAGALPRLINMGVEPFLVTGAINAIIGQRLVRKLCQECKKEYTPSEGIINEIKPDLEIIKAKPPYKFYKALGCSNCADGYKGRIGLFEVMPMTNIVEETVLAKRSSDELAKVAQKEGMITMRQDGLSKALRGVTSLDEVLRVTVKEV